MKYTREDVIITRKQAEEAGLKKGMACYLSNLPRSCVSCANKGIDGSIMADTLEDIDWDRGCPFKDSSHGIWWDCVIIKKKPEKKIVPFDFSLKEDRDALMGRRIISTSSDILVTAFAYWSGRGWMLQVDSESGFDSDYILNAFVFSDTGEPVGKEVEG